MNSFQSTYLIFSPKLSNNVTHSGSMLFLALIFPYSAVAILHDFTSMGLIAAAPAERGSDSSRKSGNMIGAKERQTGM
jgi:hypothetical protein